MNYQTQEPGFVVDTKTVALVVGLVTLVGAVGTAFDRFYSYESKLKRLEEAHQQYIVDRNQLIEDLKVLNREINSINVNVKEIKVTLDLMKQQESSSFQRK